MTTFISMVAAIWRGLLQKPTAIGFAGCQLRIGIPRFGEKPCGDSLQEVQQGRVVPGHGQPAGMEADMTARGQQMR